MTSPLVILALSVCLSLPQDSFLFSVSVVSGVTCVILAIIKFMLGRVLTSRALVTDGRRDALRTPTFWFWLCFAAAAGLSS